MLPNVSTSVLVPLTTLVPLYVLCEAALSFLELWASANGQTSLGSKVTESFQSTVGGEGLFAWWDIWWIPVFPALAVTTLTVTPLLTGDRLADLLDPRDR